MEATGIEDPARALIREFEGLRLVAYRCPAGVWTIGYGHTRGVKRGQIISPGQAECYLSEDILDAKDAIARQVRVPLTKNQLAALISWVFNLGEGNLRKSTLLKKLNAGDYDVVPSEMKKWNKAGGKVLPGLTRRREAEAELWVR